MTTTQITLMRHGETTWNAARRFQGHADSPLNDTGREQARRAANYLAQAHIQAIIASDLQRAYDTASIVGQALRLPVSTDHRLREIDVGDWQGKTYEEIQDGEQIAFWQLRRNDNDFRFPGGESHAELGQRGAAALQDIARQRPGQHTLVVAHGGTIRMTLLTLLGSVEIDRVPNTSLTRLHFKKEKWAALDIAQDAATVRW
jgi:broad specificity phosphatase PhoE